MEYRKLGNTDMLISRISFGCMSLKPDASDNEYLLHKAVDGGVNFFDTADLYNKGANEVLVGKALKDKREDVYIATKVGNQWRADGSGWDWNPTKAYIIDAVEKSLSRLATDRIDLYQLHGGTMEDPIDETIEAFELLKAQGKIRYYGISSIRPNVIRRWIERSNLSSVMMQYSLLDQRPAEQCLGFLLDRGVGVLARGSLAQGLLVGKPGKPYLNRSEDEVKKASEALSTLANAERSKTSLAVRYVLHHPAITSAVVGMRSMEQLSDLLTVVGNLADEEYRELEAAGDLLDQEVQQLEAPVPPNFYQEHR